MRGGHAGRSALVLPESLGHVTCFTPPPKVRTVLPHWTACTCATCLTCSLRLRSRALSFVLSHLMTRWRNLLTQNPGPTEYERDCAEERCARRTRTNEAGDAAPGSQDSTMPSVVLIQKSTLEHDAQRSEALGSAADSRKCGTASPARSGGLRSVVTFDRGGAIAANIANGTLQFGTLQWVTSFRIDDSRTESRGAWRGGRYKAGQSALREQGRSKSNWHP